MRKKAVLVQLHEAHDAALFSRANFDAVSSDKVTYRGKEYSVTDFIKEKTAVYMRTYVSSRILFAIQEIRRKPESK